MTDPFTLAARLDTTAAPPLAAALAERAAGGQAITLDGAAVTEIGLACLQVLASARATASARGLPFVIAGRSDALAAGCALAGMRDLLAPAS